MTPTTHSQAAIPKLPSHPEPHSMTWSRLELELETIDDYGARCFEAGRAELTRPQEVVRTEPVGEAGTKLYTAPPSTAPAQSQDHLADAESSGVQELTCSRSKRSDCALFDTSRRPSKEWYAAKIAETEELDNVLPSGALAAEQEDAKP